MDDFNTWKQSYAAQRLQEELQEGKLTPEGLSKAISDNPVVRQAEQLVRQSMEAERRKSLDEAKLRIETEIAEIGNPDIQTLEDIRKLPNYEAFRMYVERGNSFADAYYLANREQITASAAKTAAAEAAVLAKQQAVAGARGKDHLTGAAARGSGAAAVPPDTMALFRELNPGVSDAEIQAFYNKRKTKE
jgi:hypothetical protein